MLRENVKINQNCKSKTKHIKLEEVTNLLGKKIKEK